MKSSTRLPALDLMRFAAALAVVLYHYIGYASNQGDLVEVSRVTRYGYLGVDLFFMISGFVILWTASGRDAAGFVIGRISRLYPAFWVSMLLTATCIYALSDRALGLRTIIANATMLPAIFDAPLIDGVYWTLEIEIRFYALVFLLLICRQMQRAEIWLYGWLAVSIGCLLVNMPWIVKYAALQPYGAFFVAGCLFYLVHAKGLTISRGIGLAVSAITCAYVSYSQRGDFLTADAVSSVVVPAVVLAFFALFPLMMRARSAPQFAYALGALTYPLYLTHAMMGLLVYRVLQPIIGSIPSLVTIFALAIAVAWTIAVTVDIPARRPFTGLLTRVATSMGIAGRKPVLET